MNWYSALSWYISKVLRYGPCVTRGSHSFTCHPLMNHISGWWWQSRWYSN